MIIDFNTPLYSNPKETINELKSLSHLNELCEVLLFNCEEYAKMDYATITHEKYRQGLNEENILGLFGTKEEYYREMANTFYRAPGLESIWKNKTDLNLNISWLNPDDRKSKKNVWEVIKTLLKKISDDPDITNKVRNGSEKITIGQILLFTTLLRIRERMVDISNDSLIEFKWQK